MERNWEMQITGTWFNQQGYKLLLERGSNNVFTGDFCFLLGEVEKRIPIHGVIMPQENDHWPLVFMIDWGRYFQGMEGFTCFQIDWGSNRKGISFDLQWTKVIHKGQGQLVASGLLHFCQFDFDVPTPAGEALQPHPFDIGQSPIVSLPDP